MKISYETETNFQITNMCVQLCVYMHECLSMWVRVKLLLLFSFTNTTCNIT